MPDPLELGNQSAFFWRFVNTISFPAGWNQKKSDMLVDMKTLKHFTLAACIGLMLLGNASADDDPAAIIERMEQAMRGDSSYAEMVMKVERPRYEREVSMRSWVKGTDYSLIFITAPARDRGTVYLMHEKNIWHYDPRIDRTIRLPSSMMAQSWMDSDFTNDDLIRESNLVDDYDHRILQTEMYEGRDSYVIEMIPKPDTPIVWGKVLMWICKNDYLQLRIENYDQRGGLVSTMELDRITTFDDRKVPSRITVTPADSKNEQTVLTYQKIAFDIDIDDRFFTRDNMQRIR